MTVWSLTPPQTPTWGVGAPLVETTVPAIPWLHPPLTVTRVEGWAQTEARSVVTDSPFPCERSPLGPAGHSFSLGLSTQFPILQLPSWDPSWLFSVMLGLRTLTPVFVFTEFANSSLGLKPGKSSAFSIHPPPPPVGPQKSPGNTMGRTSVSGPSSQSHKACSSLLSTCPPWLGSITVTQAKSVLPMGEDVYSSSDPGTLFKHSAVSPKVETPLDLSEPGPQPPQLSHRCL